MIAHPGAGSIPGSPGVYHFRDIHGRVIYVGKAKSLRSRLSSYFVKPGALPPRTAQMMSTAESVDWISVDTEVEALLLEYSLIQKHLPRFNIRYRDDKSYPFLALTLTEEWPRAMVVRGKKKPGNRYFGPFGHAYAIRETLDLLLRTFPVRTCSNSKFNRHATLEKPCLLYHIEKCSGPCVGEVEVEEYMQKVAELIRFMEGDTDEFVANLRQKMQVASEEMNYELAARWRDRLHSVERAVEKQQMVDDKREDFDVLGLADDPLEAAAQVFFVRKGKVLGRRGFILDKVEDLTSAQLMSRILERVYYEENPLGSPKRVYVPLLPENLKLYSNWLSERRGSNVDITIPMRGAKRTLGETVRRNAEESLARHRLKRASDHNSRAKALSELAEYLNLAEAPLRIECYDMSHLSGQDYVGSMVVMEDGLPRKRDYRHFRLRDVAGNDDFAAMEEVLTRRLMKLSETNPGGDAAGGTKSERAKSESTKSESSKPGGDVPGSAGGDSAEALPPVESFAYPPGLLLLDGGKGQLGVGLKVLQKLNLDIPVAALAKEFEEVYIPGRRLPVSIPRPCEALYLLQRIRDESHRFAVSYQRKLRGKRMTRSVLDDIPALGPVRRQRLIKEFGSVKAVRNASLEELQELSWLPKAVAKAVHEKTSTSNL